MIATAQGVISGQVSSKGYTVVKFGVPRFPNELAVVMPADVVAKDGNMTMWFRVDFAHAGGETLPFGPAKVGMTEADVS